MNYLIKFSFKKTGVILSVYILVFLFGFTAVSFGQEKSNREEVEVFHSLGFNEIAKFSNYNFKGSFAALLVSDKTSNYYYLDLSKLVSSFEFKYFLFLANQSGYNIQYGHGLSANRGWFIDNKKKLEKVTLKQILEMKQNAEVKGKLLSESEKDNWIKSKNY